MVSSDSNEEHPPPSSKKRTTIPACPSSISPGQVSIPPSSLPRGLHEVDDLQELAFALHSALSRLRALTLLIEESRSEERTRLLYLAGVVREALETASSLAEKTQQRRQGAEQGS